jgi:hypothetical protein
VETASAPICKSQTGYLHGHVFKPDLAIFPGIPPFYSICKREARFIAAGGSGCSASFIPAVPAAWSVTTIAFIVRLPVCGRSSSSEFLYRRDENKKAKLDGLMTVGY